MSYATVRVPNDMIRISSILLQMFYNERCNFFGTSRTFRFIPHKHESLFVIEPMNFEDINIPVYLIVRKQDKYPRASSRSNCSNRFVYLIKRTLTQNLPAHCHYLRQTCLRQTFDKSSNELWEGQAEKSFFLLGTTFAFKGVVVTIKLSR